MNCETRFLAVKPNTSTLPLACLAIALFSLPSSSQSLPPLPTAVHPPKAGAVVRRAEGRPNIHSLTASRVCAYSYTVGKGSTFMNYCVTINGNLYNFESPAGVEMLDQDLAVEGYGICDLSNGNEYYDYEYEDSGNWNAPTTVKNTSSEVEIQRTTSDGAWTLTQTITEEKGPPPYAKVVMALKNASGVTKSVELLRFAGFLGDNTASSGDFNENYDGTLNSTWGYVPDFNTYASPSDPYGLMLQTVGSPTPTSVPYANEGFPINTENGPNPCDSGANFVSTIINGEGSGVLWYAFTLSKEQTVTVTDRYISF